MLSIAEIESIQTIAFHDPDLAYDRSIIACLKKFIARDLDAVNPERLTSRSIISLRIPHIIKGQDANRLIGVRVDNLLLVLDVVENHKYVRNKYYNDENLVRQAIDAHREQYSTLTSDSVMYCIINGVTDFRALAEVMPVDAAIGKNWQIPIIVRPATPHELVNIPENSAAREQLRCVQNGKTAFLTPEQYDVVSRIRNCEQQGVVLLTAPPGAGKTFISLYLQQHDNAHYIGPARLVQSEHKIEAIAAEWPQTIPASLTMKQLIYAIDVEYLRGRREDTHAEVLAFIMDEMSVKQEMAEKILQEWRILAGPLQDDMTSVADYAAGTELNRQNTLFFGDSLVDERLKIAQLLVCYLEVIHAENRVNYDFHCIIHADRIPEGIFCVFDEGQNLSTVELLNILRIAERNNFQTVIAGDMHQQTHSRYCNDGFIKSWLYQRHLTPEIQALNTTFRTPQRVTGFVCAWQTLTDRACGKLKDGALSAITRSNNNLPGEVLYYAMRKHDNTKIAQLIRQHANDPRALVFIPDGSAEQVAAALQPGSRDNVTMINHDEAHGLEAAYAVVIIDEEDMDILARLAPEAGQDGKKRRGEIDKNQAAINIYHKYYTLFSRAIEKLLVLVLPGSKKAHKLQTLFTGLTANISGITAVEILSERALHAQYEELVHQLLQENVAEFTNKARKILHEHFSPEEEWQILREYNLVEDLPAPIAAQDLAEVSTDPRLLLQNFSDTPEENNYLDALLNDEPVWSEIITILHLQNKARNAWWHSIFKNNTLIARLLTTTKGTMLLAFLTEAVLQYMTMNGKKAVSGPVCMFLANVMKSEANFVNSGEILLHITNIVVAEQHLINDMTLSGEHAQRAKIVRMLYEILYDALFAADGYVLHKYMVNYDMMMWWGKLLQVINANMRTSQKSLPMLDWRRTGETNQTALELLLWNLVPDAEFSLKGAQVFVRILMYMDKAKNPRVMEDFFRLMLEELRKFSLQNLYPLITILAHPSTFLTEHVLAFLFTEDREIFRQIPAKAWLAQVPGTDFSWLRQIISYVNTAAREKITDHPTPAQFALIAETGIIEVFHAWTVGTRANLESHKEIYDLIMNETSCMAVSILNKNNNFITAEMLLKYDGLLLKSMLLYHADVTCPVTENTRKMLIGTIFNQTDTAIMNEVLQNLQTVNIVNYFKNKRQVVLRLLCQSYPEIGKYMVNKNRENSIVEHRRRQEQYHRAAVRAKIAFDMALFPVAIGNAIMVTQLLFIGSMAGYSFPISQILLANVITSWLTFGIFSMIEIAGGRIDNYNDMVRYTLKNSFIMSLCANLPSLALVMEFEPGSVHKVLLISLLAATGMKGIAKLVEKFYGRQAGMVSDAREAPVVEEKAGTEELTAPRETGINPG